MNRLKFDIKYRPQIESGEYKVILDCGVEAEILAWDKPGEYPIVCMAKKEGAIPFRTDNNGIAYHYPEGSNYSDLFIITTEPELSEFEKKVYSYCDGKTVGEELIKRIAKELLDLAMKEALKDLPRWVSDGLPEGTGAIDISGLCGFDFLRRKGRLLSVSSIEKLSGFKED